MREITIFLSDELAEAIERHRQRFANSPALEVVARHLLEERVGVGTSIDHESSLIEPHPAIRFPTGPRLEPLAHMVEIADGSSIAEAAIEDRR